MQINRLAGRRKFDIVADWTVNSFCNFQCPYCFGLPMQKEKAGCGISKAIETVNETGLVWLIHFGGMEPFFHPDFIQLCRGLTTKNFISINTNLSHPLVYDLCENINKDRIEFIHASLHITERERMHLVEDFIEKVGYLKKIGLDIFVSQVMWPPVIKRFGEIFNFFKKYGIIIRPKAFRGYYNKRFYPQAYSKEEKDSILFFIKEAERFDGSLEATNFYIDLDFEKYFVEALFSFKESLCFAGKEFISICPDGHVWRCSGEKTFVGNIFKGGLKLFDAPKICNCKICPCPYQGFRYSLGRPVQKRLTRLDFI